ncbi:hypothetical protein NYO98_10405 [Nocardioides sp. STR2]|uniref:Sec-independent protein translocase protein TatB n=1 Tax=Nocardioides pini TaxID=2975053 RepID=A0ABT4CFE9_9ACTN|nr:hypothetical protein [Nocardioides pini]MCY4726689.1 hypothetical protein [Nocardioides pini]
MNTIQAVVALITALGVGTILPEIGKAAIGYFTNRRPREQKENNRLRRERDTAEANARIAREHASNVRRIAIDNGVDPAKFPPFPRTVRPPAEPDAHADC